MCQSVMLCKKFLEHRMTYCLKCGSIQYLECKHEGGLHLRVDNCLIGGVLVGIFKVEHDYVKLGILLRDVSLCFSVFQYLNVAKAWVQ